MVPVEMLEDAEISRGIEKGGDAVHNKPCFHGITDNDGLKTKDRTSNGKRDRRGRVQADCFQNHKDLLGVGGDFRYAVGGG